MATSAARQGAQQGLEARVADVEAREAAVAAAQTALLSAENMLRKVTESALQEKAEYQAAAKNASREADLVYKAECAARVKADERAAAAEAKLEQLEMRLAAAQGQGGQGGAGSSATPLWSCTQLCLPCIAGAFVGAMLVAR